MDEKNEDNNIEGKTSSKAKRKLKRGLLKIGRMFGFGYPEELVVLRHDGSVIKYLEDPDIFFPKDEKLPKLQDDVKTKQDLNQLEKKISLDDDCELNAEHSIIREKKPSSKVHVVNGDVRSHFKSAAPKDYFSVSSAALAVPLIAVYNIILFFAFGVISWSPYLTVVTTFLVSLGIFQGYRTQKGSIQALDVEYRGQVSGLEIFVPLRKKFLKIEPSDDKNMVSDVTQMLISYFRPILGENKSQTEEFINLQDRFKRAKRMGERKTMNQLQDQTKSKWFYILVGLSIGAAVGWILSGGLTAAPPEPVSGSGNETAGVILSAVRGCL